MKRLLCALFRHRPIKVVDAAEVKAVTLVPRGVHTEMRVTASHIECNRCRRPL